MFNRTLTVGILVALIVVCLVLSFFPEKTGSIFFGNLVQCRDTRTREVWDESHISCVNKLTREQDTYASIFMELYPLVLMTLFIFMTAKISKSKKQNP